MSAASPVRILVTGCTGRVATVACADLVAAGLGVVGIDVREPEADVGYDFRICDLTQEGALDSHLQDMDAGLHLAAIPSPRRAHLPPPLTSTAPALSGYSRPAPTPVCAMWWWPAPSTPSATSSAPAWPLYSTCASVTAASFATPAFSSNSWRPKTPTLRHNYFSFVELGEA